jgi:hypothetical protein
MLTILPKSYQKPACHTAQAAVGLVKDMERAVERYSRGMGHLREKLPLPGPPQIVLVTHRRDTAVLGRPFPEAVIQSSPPWGSTIPAPASWDSLPSQEPDVSLPPLLWIAQGCTFGCCRGVLGPWTNPLKVLFSLSSRRGFYNLLALYQTIYTCFVCPKPACMCAQDMPLAGTVEDTIQLYLSTPLGPGTAQISHTVVQHFMKASLLLLSVCTTFAAHAHSEFSLYRQHVASHKGSQ